MDKLLARLEHKSISAHVEFVNRVCFGRAMKEADKL